MGDSDPEVQARLARLQVLEAATSSLRHDLRGILSPAMLIADRLLAHPDPVVQRAGNTVVRSIQQAEKRLRDTKEEG